MKTEAGCTSKTLVAYIYTRLRALISKLRHSSYTVVRTVSRENAPLEDLGINGWKILNWISIKGCELRTVFNVLLNRDHDFVSLVMKITFP